MPAVGIDQTSHTIMSLFIAQAIRRAATITIFKITGAAAATANLPVVFKMPENKAAKEINSM